MVALLCVLPRKSSKIHNMSEGHLPLKDLSKLNKKHFRDETGLFLIEGKKIFAEAKAAGAGIQQVLVTGKFLHEQSDFLQENGLTPRDITVIADHNAERLSETQTPPGIFAVVTKPEVSVDTLFEKNFVAAFENVRDPGNMGTMIRTADWFGVNGILTSETSVDAYNDKVLRGSMGSVFHLDVVSSLDFQSDIEELKAHGFTIVVTRPENADKKETSFIPKQGQKICLVLGNESLGTSAGIDQLADAFYSIPRLGKAESLNVAVSFGIILHDFQQKH